MNPPPIRYIERDGGRLAYQVVGSGPSDVVWLLECMNHLDLLLTDPHLNHLFERASAYSQILLVQRRGFGSSDPIDYVPSLEQQAEDILALMDEVGMSQATLAENLGTSPVALLIAATHPSRVRSVLVLNPLVQGSRTTKPVLGWTREEIDRFGQDYVAAAAHWGDADALPLWESALESGFNRRLWSMLERCSASRDAACAYLEGMLTVDDRPSGHHPGTRAGLANTNGRLSGECRSRRRVCRAARHVFRLADARTGLVAG